MFKPVLIAALVLVGTTAPSFAKMDADEFVKKAAMGGMFEVQSSQIALDQAESDHVRTFAQEMVNDHEAANETLKSIAAQAGIEVPAQLDQKHQAKLEKLQAADANFEKQYVNMQVEAHDTAIKLYETYARDGDNEALKEFAQQTLPTLEEHHEDLSQLASAQTNPQAKPETN